MQLHIALDIRARRDPAQVILDQVERLDVDLLIIGSHGEGCSADTPLGRTATRVLQLSTVPVYLVPLGQTLNGRAPGQGE